MSTKYIYFDVYDYTNTQTTTSYALSITPFTCIPKLDSGILDDVISTTNILWDFGDGTTSKEITAQHAYLFPGSYTITVYIASTSGRGYESMFSQNVFVRDFIRDSVTISRQSNYVGEAGGSDTEFLVERTNSWQTYDALGERGSIIHLSVSGNCAPFYTESKYANDKYAHLKPHSKFIASQQNIYTGATELIPVNNVYTVHNMLLYAKKQNNTIVLCEKSDEGSVFVGTSGYRSVYFVDELTNPIREGFVYPPPIRVQALMGGKVLSDASSRYAEYLNLQIPVINQSVSDSSNCVMIEKSRAKHLSITSNGLDEEYGTARFNISPNKFLNQPFSVVIKVKDEDNATLKTLPVFQLVDNEALLSANNTIFIDIQNNENESCDCVISNTPVSGVTNGGFIKVSVECLEPLSSAKIVAKSHTYIPQKYLISSSNVLVAPNFSFDLLKNYIISAIPIDYSQGSFATAVVPNVNIYSGEINYNSWVAFSDTDILVKYNENYTPLLSVSLPGGAPASIASGIDEDIWVAMLDNVSVVKIKHDTGQIIAYATPPIQNIFLDKTFEYRGYTGQNLIIPTAIDIDTGENLWVTYTHPMCSFVCKYSSNGNFLHLQNAFENYRFKEIISTPHHGVWSTLEHIETISASKIVCFDNEAKIVSSFDVMQVLKDLTLDEKDNIWISTNTNTLVQVDTSSFLVHEYDFLVDGAFDAVGMSYTTQNKLLLIDGNSKKLYSVDTTLEILTAVTLTSFNTPNSIYAHGDWTGIKHISRYWQYFLDDVYLQSASNKFTVFENNSSYKVSKINENFDAADFYKAYTFQESFQNYEVLQHLFEAIAGNIDSSPNTLGKKTYEKIANFVENTGIVDTCNINALYAMYSMMGENLSNLAMGNYASPAEINRLIDMLSIKFNVLNGYSNKFANFFDKKFQTSENINLGDEIDIYTKVLTGGVDYKIVSYEKFSKKYNIINTNLAQNPNINYIDSTLQTYALSSYDLSWGWGLVLPKNHDARDIFNSYSFFEYVSGYNNDQISGIINWNSDKTTISRSVTSYNEWSNTIENIFYHTLAEGLDLI